MKQWQVSETEVGMRVDQWLAKMTEVGSRSRARMAIGRGKAFINGVALSPSQAGMKLQAGDTVGLWMDRPGTSRPRRHGMEQASIQLYVIHEDQDLLVLDKPAGLLVEPLPRDEETITLLDLVKDHLRFYVHVRPRVVHRIDRGTTGLVVMAKTDRSYEILKERFLEHRVQRAYLALLRGQVWPREGTWEDRLVWDKERLIQRAARERDSRARRAVSSYRVVEQLLGAALVEITLVTGKRNQIRIQAAMHGFPLIGERLYTAGPPQADEPRLGRQALHAWKLAFAHPATSRRMEFISPLPNDMKGLIGRLRGALNKD